MKIIIVFLLATCLSCNQEKVVYSEDMLIKPESEMAFDKEKWRLKDGADYPFRDKMVNDIIYNDTIRSLHKNEILVLLGEPSYIRDDDNFLHYRITEKRLGTWTLHTKTLVMKFFEDETIDWIKIHE